MNDFIKAQFNFVMGVKSQIIIDKVVSNDKELFTLKKVLTAGHGYYVITRQDSLYPLAKRFCKENDITSFNENLVFLEEDSEIKNFVNSL
jgi:hypothetical protein